MEMYYVAVLVMAATFVAGLVLVYAELKTNRPLYMLLFTGVAILFIIATIFFGSSLPSGPTG